MHPGPPPSRDPGRWLAHGQAPMSSHLEPTHPAGVGWRMGSWVGSKGKAEKKHPSLSNWKVNKPGHKPEENIEKEAHLKKVQERGLGGKEKKIPLGAEDSCPSGQGVDDTGPQCSAGCARRTSVTHSRMSSRRSPWDLTSHLTPWIQRSAA